MKKTILPFPIMFAVFLSGAVLLYVLVPVGFWVLISPIDNSSLIELLFLLALFSVPLLLLALLACFFKLYFLLFCQPVHFSEEGVRQGKASIAWSEITVHGVAQPFLSGAVRLGREDLIVYLAAGNPKAGLWTALGVISVWEVLYVQDRMPRFYKFLVKYLDVDTSNSLASLYDENDLPKKMVWFKFDEKLYYECVKRIRQKTLTQLQ